MEKNTLCPLAIIGIGSAPGSIDAPCDPDRCMLALSVSSGESEYHVCGLIGFDAIKVIAGLGATLTVNTSSYHDFKGR